MPDPTPLAGALERAAHPIAARAAELATKHTGRPVAPADPAAAIRARQADRDRARARELAASQAGTVPTRYLTAEPGAVPPVATWCERVLAGHRGSLVILGTVGTGKTHEAFAAWRALVLAGYGGGQARWASVPAMLEGLRPGREPALTEADAIACPLLLLDDLAAERGSDWTVEVLYRILDARYSWERPTIVTSNTPPGEVRERLGDRIASRLNGIGEVVAMTGPDRRAVRP